MCGRGDADLVRLQTLGTRGIKNLALHLVLEVWRSGIRLRLLFLLALFVMFSNSPGSLNVLRLGPVMISSLFLLLALDVNIEIVCHSAPHILHLINVGLNSFQFVLGILSLPLTHSEPIVHLLFGPEVVLLVDVFLKWGFIFLGGSMGT